MPAPTRPSITAAPRLPKPAAVAVAVAVAPLTLPPEAVRAWALTRSRPVPARRHCGGGSSRNAGRDAVHEQPCAGGPTAHAGTEVADTAHSIVGHVRVHRLRASCISGAGSSGPPGDAGPTDACGSGRTS
jgi:hypothetical protein